VRRQTDETLMEEHEQEWELLSMITFALEQSAERITTLACQVRSESLRIQLTELCRDLLHCAHAVEQRRVKE
jgi:hypothetical protein